MPSERSAKRARGNYAKLICLRCRERRIKCQLPYEQSIQPSSDPQPPEKACERCKQKGLECIVRKTTLGRPSQKHNTLPETTPLVVSETLRSPSPEADDFVLLKLTNESDNEERGQPAVGAQPTSLQLMGAVGKNFDLTSALLARDLRFGSTIFEARDTSPLSLERVLNRGLVELLDEHLVWQRIYIPWLPSLIPLFDEATRSDVRCSSSTLLLAALLAFIALDTPSLCITSTQRALRSDLQTIIYHAGQEVLFTLPRQSNTLTTLVLVHGYKPLQLIQSRSAAAHTLSGKLYPTLIQALQQQLGFDKAAAQLRSALNGTGSEKIPHLVMNAIEWCSTLSFRLSQELDELDVQHDALEHTTQEMTNGFEVIEEAIDRGLAPSNSIFIFHVVRYHADCSTAMRNATANWNNLAALTSVISEYERLCASRKTSFERHLANFFYRHGKASTALALSQLSDMELHQGHTKILGLCMLFAIVSGAQKPSSTDNIGQEAKVFRRYYSDAVHEEAGNSTRPKTEVREFLDKYGNAHMDGLERRLTDFINAANEIKLEGISFVGPARHITSNVLMACKEVAENNAVRIKLDGELHHRVDMQLILFQEAARCLEGMEADGNTAEAVGRGSMFAAAAKLVRNLHRIVSQWKRSYLSKARRMPNETTWNETAPPSMEYSDSAMYPSPFDSLFTDDLNWQDWPQLDTTDLSNLMNFDFEPTGL